MTGGEGQWLLGVIPRRFFVAHDSSYGKFLADDGAAPLIQSLQGAKMRTFRIPSEVCASNYAEKQVVPGGIEPRATEPASGAQSN